MLVEMLLRNTMIHFDSRGNGVLFFVFSRLEVISGLPILTTCFCARTCLLLLFYSITPTQGEERSCQERFCLANILFTSACLAWPQRQSNKKTDWAICEYEGGREKYSHLLCVPQFCTISSTSRMNKSQRTGDFLFFVRARLTWNGTGSDITLWYQTNAPFWQLSYRNRISWSFGLLWKRMNIQ